MKKTLLLALFLAFTGLSYCQISLHPLGTKLHVASETVTLLNMKTYKVNSYETIKRDFDINLQEYVEFDWDFMKIEKRKDLKDVDKVVTYERYKDGERQELEAMLDYKGAIRGFIISNPKRGVIQVYVVDLIRFIF